MSNVRSTNAPRAVRSADKPAGIAMNLDSLHREVTVEPFVVVIAGKPREFLDPNEMDWQELMQILQDPRVLFQLALSEEDYQAVMASRIPVWKMRALTDAYAAHYGIDWGNLSASQT